MLILGFVELIIIFSAVFLGAEYSKSDLTLLEVGLAFFLILTGIMLKTTYE